MRRFALALAGTSLALAGCGFQGVQSIPLPGGPDLGDDPYEVSIEFENVLDLVPQSTVKVNDVNVGRVEDITLDGWRARVTVRLNDSVKLPDNAVATISQTSLLGEKYVAISPPEQGATGELGDGDEIEMVATSSSTEVEEVLSALSMLLNGGGIEQISTITKELNAAMSGREESIKSVLRRIDTFVGTLDRQRDTITDALDKIDDLLVKLDAEKETIADTIEKTEPAIAILEQNQKDLTKMLVGLDKFGDISTKVIRDSKRDLLTNLKNLQPVLKNLNKTGDKLPEHLGTILTFPFSDAFSNTVRGDFANMNMTVSLDIEELAHNLLTGTEYDKALDKSLKKQAEALRDLVSPPGISVTQTPPGVLGVGDEAGSGTSILPSIGMGDVDPAVQSLLMGGLS
ncbi:phospholipid/cholesterol/gamma-HCH transport system substrate-binding protein [Actinocorallia herbida]|uniref:Phospholipid/cholesterol/gamma-HCH transport system substrate-binding protein n=1 Tax=Actinocorallia herbida TaxID=58109 RepID=A0A3N1DCF4_9ACTN|nr:MCE family protein [Actinocorallia herbida]ROO91191.1 phospholipid/cholesterol/gamma-HCH transport system substrate-binding protein [Actinocorallia herbida]